MADMTNVIPPTVFAEKQKDKGRPLVISAYMRALTEDEQSELTKKVGGPLSREQRAAILDAIPGMRSQAVVMVHILLGVPLNQPISPDKHLGVSLRRILEELDFIEAIAEMQ